MAVSEPAASVAPVRSAGTICIRQTVVHVVVVVRLTYSPRGCILASAEVPWPFKICTQQNYWLEMVKVTELVLILMVLNSPFHFSHCLHNRTHQDSTIERFLCVGGSEGVCQRQGYCWLI